MTFQSIRNKENLLCTFDSNMATSLWMKWSCLHKFLKYLEKTCNQHHIYEDKTNSLTHAKERKKVCGYGTCAFIWWCCPKCHKLPMVVGFSHGRQCECYYSVGFIASIGFPIKTMVSMYWPKHWNNINFPTLQYAN